MAFRTTPTPFRTAKPPVDTGPVPGTEKLHTFAVAYLILPLSDETIQDTPFHCLSHCHADADRHRFP